MTLPERNDIPGIAAAWREALRDGEMSPELAEMLVMLCDDPDDLARALRDESA